MSNATIVPLAILATLLVCVIAVGPSVWLTRSSRALGVRAISGRALTVAWGLAAVPWTIVLLYLHYRPHFSISIDGFAETVAASIIVIVMIVLLLSLPLAVVVLSVMRFLDRKIIGAK